MNHDTDPWIQPIFALTANRLAALGIGVPELLITTGFHKANINTSLTVLYDINPKFEGITTPQTNWDASPWHPNHIKQFPDKAVYINERLQWTESWFQIFKAMQPVTHN